jgi:putative ATP-binding cassette transporter
MALETDASKQRILFLAAVSGIANSFLLVILNQAAMGLEDGQLEGQLFVQYLLTFILFIFAQRASQREAVTAVEYALQKVRIRIADKVRKSELRTIENLGDMGSYSSLTQGASTIAQSAMYMVTGIESLLVLIFASLYLLWLSPPSFVVAMVLILGTIALLVKHYQKTFLELSEATRKEGQFFEYFTSILKGFKQLKTNRKQSDDLFSHIEQLATETSDLKSRSNVRLLEDILLSNVTFYLLLLIVVFLLPSLLIENEENLFQLITTILFMMEPVSRISSALPNISKTNVAINNLYKLEAELDVRQRGGKEKSTSDRDSEDHSVADEIITFELFNTLHLEASRFSYVNAQQQSLFQAGPFTLTLQRGETIFITGGNGSGKSTFLKLITGLYQADKGFIKVDDALLTAEQYAAYRELFSVVFDDFHLFDRLYGFTETPELEINYWLDRLDIYHKTRFENGSFTNLDLSTGQRKRLAFIAAIIQDRPILVFDELAADQEPEFRQRFYEEILPELKDQGKTIIAVTHDDRYFSSADRVLHMEAGRLEERII